MVSRPCSPSPIGLVPAGILIVALIVSPLVCGCLQVEPEELPPATTPLPVAITAESPTLQPSPSTPPRIPPPVAITSPRLTALFATQEFPPEVKAAVNDYTEGRTSASIDNYLHWESVRSRTNRQEMTGIREQLSRIDYAVYNTSIRENITVYVGLTADQARKIRNESVFSENSYLIASYDPSVVYTRRAATGRDTDGFFTLAAIDCRPGSHLLFINASEREFLLPRGGIWDVAGEDTYRELTFSADSIPRFDDIIQTDVRIIRTKEHP